MSRKVVMNLRKTLISTGEHAVHARARTARHASIW